MSRPKSKSNVYWTEETDKALTAYLMEDNPIKKNQIFSSKLYIPFIRLAESIHHVYAYASNKNEEFEEVQKDIVAHLILKLPTWSALKGSGFSYFGTIAKHYLYDNMTSSRKYNLHYVPLGEHLSNEDILTQPDTSISDYYDSEAKQYRITNIKNYLKYNKIFPTKSYEFILDNLDVDDIGYIGDEVTKHTCAEYLSIKSNGEYKTNTMLYALRRVVIIYNRIMSGKYPEYEVHRKAIQKIIDESE